MPPGTSPGYGRPGPQWPDSFAIFDSWKNNARAWTQTPTQAGDTMRNKAMRSPWLHETITAGYAMADANCSATGCGWWAASVMS